MPTFDRFSSSTAKAWRKELHAFFRLHLVVEKEFVQIAALHLQGEANEWWFGHIEHAKVTKYSYFFQRIRKKFDRRKPETFIIEKFPKKSRENVILATLDKESLHSPLAAEVLVSGGETLASLQGSLKLLTYRVPCMIQEMHEEEEENSNAGKLTEE